MFRTALLALLLTAPALRAGPTLSLPPGEASQPWEDALQLAGFQLTVDGADASAVVQVEGGQWRLRVIDAAGEGRGAGREGRHQSLPRRMGATTTPCSVVRGRPMAQSLPQEPTAPRWPRDRRQARQTALEVSVWEPACKTAKGMSVMGHQW